MGDRLKPLEVALRELGKQIGEIPLPNTMLETSGWNTPPLTVAELGQISTNLAIMLSRIPDDAFEAKYQPDRLVLKIEQFKASTLPYFSNGNVSGAYPAYLALLEYIEALFSPFFIHNSNWEKVAEDKKLPKALVTKIRSFNSTLDQLDVDFPKLQEKLQYINETHQAALDFPADLVQLRTQTAEASELRTQAEKHSVLAGTALERIESLSLEVEEKHAEAIKLVENIEDAYSAATTKGLAEAFQNRANTLARSMWVWVAGLAVALVLGAMTGSQRISALQNLLTVDASGGKITLGVMLALVTVAGPIWFAWIATKQIGHRFRLSEDYGFKASVAQSYEGYRRQAARLDESFAKRLFGSALDRIDEAPLRFVENETFGSPWHEALQMRVARNTAGAPEHASHNKIVASEDTGA